MTDPQKQIVFLPHAIPPLRGGAYIVSATQAIPGQQAEPFGAKATLIVSGERFSVRPTEFDSVFPPNLANGEFGGVLPHVLFTRTTLPWERTLDTPGSACTHPNAPWLAILVCDGATAPAIQTVAARDLVSAGTPIEIAESSGTDKGTLDKGTLSYFTVLPPHQTTVALESDETPDDACQVIDLPIAVFNQIAPTATDLSYLAHVREVDVPTTDETGAPTQTVKQLAVVVANRVPPRDGPARAFLVSLEGLADYLPAADGTQSRAVPAGAAFVRLLVYQAWSFTANDLDETLEKLLAGLIVVPPPDDTSTTTLALPLAGRAPTSARVAAALANQSKGTLVADDATVLVQNALLLGYVPLDHHVRRGGDTVSWYRGPLAPLPVPPLAPEYYSGPDAALAYDPQTGLFDASYAAAWQLGQLLALQSIGMANQLYQWKRAVTLQQALTQERTKLVTRLRGATVFESILGPAAPPLGDGGAPELPDDVATWFGNLARLEGVPFNYLVPDERMLPPESLRFFYLDPNWIDALVDGAFSIGRGSVSDTTVTGVRASLEAVHAPRIRALARDSAVRKAPSPAAITGLLVRSQAVSGWPNLRVVGFRDDAATDAIDAMRTVQLASDTVLCLFGDVVAAVCLREPPEALHCGLDFAGAGYATKLRSVNGGPGKIAAGAQYGTAAPIPMRADGRTLQVTSAAVALQQRLVIDYQQQFPDGFTSAELALELTKGVVEVEYHQ